MNAPRSLPASGRGVAQPGPGSSHGAPCGPANAVRTLPRHQSPATFLILPSLGAPTVVVSERQPLHAADRERMRHAIRALRLAADRMEEALDSNRAVEALEAATLGSDAGQVAVTVATLLGHKS